MPANLPLLYGIPSMLDWLMNHEGGTALPATVDISACHFPPVQVVEDDNAVHVRAMLSGIAPNKVSLVIENNILTIRGEVPAPEGVQLRRERATGPFRREVRLPCVVAEGPLKAAMRNGILTVVLPKDHASRKRSINISAGAAS